MRSGIDIMSIGFVKIYYCDVAVVCSYKLQKMSVHEKLTVALVVNEATKSPYVL